MLVAFLNLSEYLALYLGSEVLKIMWFLSQHKAHQIRAASVHSTEKA